MIKRIYVLILIVTLTFYSSFADEQKRIVLNNDDHKSETVVFDNCCNIFVSLIDVDDEGNVKISIELENTHESYSLMLFFGEYPEYILKKSPFYIRFDKHFGGRKGYRSVDFCSIIGNNIIIRPSEKSGSIVVPGVDTVPIICKLPIYIAKKKYKCSWFKTMSLLEKVVIELNIQIQLKPDEDYVRIFEAYNALIKEMNSEYFCTNKDHKGPSYNDLKRKYEKKIDQLRDEITAIKNSRDYWQNDLGYQKFKTIDDDLGKISIEARKVSSCPKDQRHRCKYCSLSCEDIYNKLANYYIDIYNGRVSKSQVMAEVEALYTCFKKNTKRASDSKCKSGITKYYDTIKSL